LERRLQLSNDQVKDLDKKLKESKTQLQTEKDALSAAKTKIADTEQILKTTKEDLANANSTNSTGAGEIAKLKADLTAANEKFVKEETSKKEAETREADVRKELATAKSDIATLKGEVATLKATSSGPAAGGSAASGTAAQIGKLTSEKAALETKCNEEIRLKIAAEKALKDATTEIGVKNQKISDLERDKATAEASVTSLTKDKNSLAAEKKTAEDAKKAAEDAKNKADAAAAQAVADLGTEKAKSARLQTHVTALETWGEQIQGVAKQQYPVYQKITEYYGGLYKFQPPAAKQNLPQKPA
jgi:chromosome segregation ATPase